MIKLLLLDSLLQELQSAANRLTERKSFNLDMTEMIKHTIFFLIVFASASASPGNFFEDFLEQDESDFDIDFEDAHEAIVKVVIIVIGVVLFLIILAVVCCCCLPCCFLAKRRTRNRGEIHQTAQPLQGGPSYPQQSSGYQLQHPGASHPQQPGGYQAGYYPPPEQQQMVPPGYPSQPPPYPGPPEGGFPVNDHNTFPTKQAPYNPNAP